MLTRPSDRTLELLNLARQNPNVGLQVLARLTPPARAEAIRHWCRMDAPDAEPRLGPGLRKCSPRPAPPATALSAQLQAFARSIGRVG